MRAFVDANVLVYARDASEAQKQRLAQSWITYLWQERKGCLSVQVLNEYFVTVTQKLKPGLSRTDAWSDVVNLRAWQPMTTTFSLMEEAWELQGRYSLSWSDALIVAAAKFARCEILLTEDFQAGHQFDGVRIVNPFLTAPADVEPSAA